MSNKELSTYGKKILESETKEQFVDLSVKYIDKITKGEKILIYKEWIKVHPDCNPKELANLKKHHPYWLKRKRLFYNDKTRQRLKDYDFSEDKYHEWEEDQLLEFIKKNSKKENGKYEYSDRVLAELFHVSLSSIHYLRRKYILAEKILQKFGEQYKLINSDEILLRFLRLNESDLRIFLKKEK